MTPRRIFVDTGAWHALQATNDDWHGDAVRTHGARFSRRL